MGVKMKMHDKKILLIDDEALILKVIREELRYEGFAVDTASDPEEGCQMAIRGTYDLVLLDYQMPAKNGLEVMVEIKKAKPDLPAIIMTAFGSIDNAVEAMKLGAYDYITKPFEEDDLVVKIRQALRVKERLNGHKADKQAETAIIGHHESICKIRKKINKIKNLDLTVLLTGDSGTGKGVIAREIHQVGNRSDQPFIHVNCAVLPKNLIESELFGHVKGSFTGAVESKTGKFELAKNGTIFLDEIGTLNHDMQAKLLTVLQERRFEPIGASETIAMNARIIAATNRNLESAVENREFREDLYYRLNVIRIECPSLRFREEDIDELVRYFIQKSNKKMGRMIESVEPSAMSALRLYRWPGNVRELENSIESAIALAEGTVLLLADLPVRIQSFAGTENVINKDSRSRLEVKEKNEIQAALVRNAGHREKTAKDLGISRRSLQYKLKKYQLS
jgi:DNA-binding NtrC family response regulator